LSSWGEQLTFLGSTGALNQPIVGIMALDW
jgi:hypothetical protein